MDHRETEDPEPDQLQLDKPTGLWPARSGFERILPPEVDEVEIDQPEVDEPEVDQQEVDERSPATDAAAGGTPTPPFPEDSEADQLFEHDTDGQIRLRKRRFANKLLTRGLPVVLLLGVIAWTLNELGSVKTGRHARDSAGSGVAHSPNDTTSPGKGVLAPKPTSQEDGEEEPEAAPLGKNISKLLTHLDLLRVVPPEGTETVRMGRDTIPPGTVTVINLWATFCAPCKKELPEFKAMFAAASERWGRKVRFVPIQVDDPADPIFSYQQFADKMPPTDAFLVDTGLGGGVRPPLVAADVITEDAGLPITLVLDCKQSVRWHATKVLSEADLTELSAKLDELHRELGQKYCRRQKLNSTGSSAGSGGTAGDAKAQPDQEPIPPVLDPETAKPETPEIKVVRPRPPPPAPPRCGDGTCQRKLEDCSCPDCACTEEEGKCAPRPTGGHFCKSGEDDVL